MTTNVFPVEEDKPLQQICMTTTTNMYKYYNKYV